MNDGASAPQSRWLAAWPDLLAFGLSLVLARQLEWQTTELVWSLWLSSLLVGYAMIVWTIFGPAVYVGWKTWTGRELLEAAPKVPIAVGGAAYMIGGLVLLGFFTFHFGLFHVVHSVFLNAFFPVGEMKGVIGLDGYLAVLQQYWYFVPLAALAERKAFHFKPVEPVGPPDTAVTVAAIAERKARNAGQGFTGLMAPYKNVIRLHLLIFFFAFAHFVKLDGFLVYAVVYAVYFFPWELRKKAGSRQDIAQA